MRHARLALAAVWVLGSSGCFPDAPAAADTVADTDTEVGDSGDEVPMDDHEATDTADSSVVCQSAGQCVASSPCVVVDCVHSACVESPKVCEPVDACHKAGVCQSDGTCTNPTQPNGFLCDDGIRCTSSDTCLAGSCQGGDKPEDDSADFNVTWNSNFGARATDLVVANNEIVMLVEFPTSDPGEERPIVDFGRTTLAGTAIIGPLADARYGLAIARFSLRGELKEALLVASSLAPITKSSLMVLSGDRLAVSARYTADVGVESYGGSRTTVTLHQGSAAYFFGFIWGQVRAISTIEFESEEFEQGTLIRHFDTDGGNCHAVVNVTGGKRAWVYTGDTLSETLSSSDSVLVESWVLWFQACAAFPTGVRRITSSGGAAALGIHAVGDGSILVQGLTKGGLSYGTRESTKALLEGSASADSGFEAFVIRILESKEAGFAMLLRDESMVEGAVAVFHGFAARQTEFVLATGLHGRAYLVDTHGTTILMPGSPAQAGQISSRVVLASIRMDGTPNWFVTTPDEAKEASMAKIAFAAEGVITSGVLTGGSFGTGQAQVVLSEVDQVAALVAGWDAGGRRWAGSLCRPTLSGGHSPFDGDDPLPIVVSPASNGMIVAGVVHAPCELGFGRKQVIGEEGKVLGFLARINSADGIGCDGP